MPKYNFFASDTIYRIICSRLRLKFSCMMELSRYPLDRQLCGMQIASCKYIYDGRAVVINSVNKTSHCSFKNDSRAAAVLEHLSSGGEHLPGPEDAPVHHREGVLHRLQRAVPHGQLQLPRCPIPHEEVGQLSPDPELFTLHPYRGHLLGQLLDGPRLCAG